jgi:cytochrome c biogenesis protein CcdA/thiol-disulfide isomerase/thioredoxin
MKSELITIFLGFLEGFVLILSPCILSILPIILASSLAGSKRRPLGIIIGFTCTFALFALFARQLVQYSGIDLNLIRYIAYGFLILLSFILLSNYLTEKFNQLTQRMAAIGSISLSNQGARGFLSGLFLGGLVAVIWTPCAGPILAAIIVQIAIQKTSLSSFFTLLAFALGAAMPMFIIAFYGMKVRDGFLFLKKRAVVFRKILGAIILLNMGYIIYQETGFASASVVVVSQSNIRTAHYLEQGLWRPYQAPRIGGIDTWINSPPLQLSDLKGKVVLVDFWTYSCINCIRTVPYLNNWYKTYHDKGLVIIGIHSPEFDFEKNVDNVKNAVKRDGIQYPVALDNLFVTWRNFANHYWPAHYLINKQGKVVYVHFGEGDDDVTENNIRFLLGIDTINTPVDFGYQQVSSFSTITPETYLGYARAETDLSPSLTHDEIAQYYFPATMVSNAWGLQGLWQVYSDKISSAQVNASLKINFNARKVYMVMGNHTNTPIQVDILLNGKKLVSNQGRDVVNSSILVDKYGLYEVVDLQHASSGILQITSNQPGLDVYTFTFGR